MAQRKETKMTIKVRDLKPKKDAKGGVVATKPERAATRSKDVTQTYIDNPLGVASNNATHQPHIGKIKWHREKKPRKKSKSAT